MRTLFHSATGIDARGTVDDVWILTEGDTIAAVGSGPAERPEADTAVDLGGATVVPGFVDIHGHGGGGFAMEDGGDALIRALATHRRHGTTRSVVSLVANPLPALHQQLRAVADLAARDPLVLGTHLEGPYLQPHRKGAHNEGFLIAPTPDDVEQLLQTAAGTLRMITIAPELPGGLDAIRRFAAAGVVAAVGHTDADLALAREAFDAGARVLTHAFNAMRGLGHRDPGPVAAAVADERVTLELILDGLHVAPEVATILFRAAPGRVALITDAMAAAGAPEGAYRLGSLDVTVKNGLATLTGSDQIAGSTLTQDRALRIAIETCGLAPAEAVAALTLIPARALGLDDHLGLLAPGYAADLAVLSDDWRVQRVWAAGEELRTAP